MTQLFLIAHKVRGEPAFDVAERMTCPLCDDPETGTQGCTQCDHHGYWWIIPTSGHRAFPIMHWELKDLCNYIPNQDWQPSVIDELGPIAAMPKFASLPDHYSLRNSREPSRPAGLTALLSRPRPALNIPRRGL